MKSTKDIELSIIKKFKKKIWRPFTKAINEYELVEDGDKIAVCISGGKDSMLMAKLFQELERHGKKNFDVVFLVMDPGYNEANRSRIESNAKHLNVPIQIFTSDIFDAVSTVEDSPCYLCARMRRGHLYNKAKHIIAAAIPISGITQTGLFERLAKMKYDIPNDKLEMFDQLIADIDSSLAKLTN